MTPKQKIELRRSEIRSRLAEISALEGETFTAEIRAENEKLLSELETSEPRLRAAIAAEDAEIRHRGDQAGGDGESAERRALIERSRLGAFIQESFRQGGLDGAERELRAAVFGTGGGDGLVPWCVLAPRQEHRADTATDVTANTGAEAFSWTDRVFADSAAMFLGVSMPIVSRGQAAFPVLTDGVAPEMKARGAAVDADAAVVSVQTLSPTRLTARYRFRLEDAARVDALEETLRADIAGALREAMDKQIVAGSGTAPEVEGLLTGIAAPDVPTVRAAYGSFIGLAASATDGRHARTVTETRLLCAVDAYRYGASLLDADNSNVAVDYLAMHSGGIRGTIHIPDAPTTGARAGIAEILCHRTMAPRAAVAPFWEGFSLQIRDEVTAAASGEVNLTAISLFSFAKLRGDGYVRFSIKITD